MDETGEQFAKQVARYFHEINDRVNLESAAVKICISSRHYPVPSNIPGIEICVEAHDTDDIRSYVHGHLDLDNRTSDLVPDLAQWYQLRDDLVQKAKGIFQWIRLVVLILEQYLDEGDSPHEANEKIRQVPEQLEGVYEHIIRNVINPRHRSTSLLLFQWVCFTRQPLSVERCRYALAARDVKPPPNRVTCCETNAFVRSDNLMIQRLKMLSGGLIEAAQPAHRGSAFYSQGLWYLPGSMNEIVQVIHQTVSDFMMSKGLRLLMSLQDESVKNGHQSELILSLEYVEQQGHAELYQSCSNYLSSGDFRGSGLRLDSPNFVKKFPLSVYAIKFMSYHGEMAHHSGTRNTSEKLRFYASFIKCFQPVRDLADPDGTCETLLNFVVRSGFTDLIEPLLQDGVDVNGLGRCGQMPLHIAASLGDLDTIRRLIDAGAAIDATDQHGYTPLSLAKLQNEIKAVKLLQDKSSRRDEQFQVQKDGDCERMELAID